MQFEAVIKASLFASVRSISDRIFECFRGWRSRGSVQASRIMNCVSFTVGVHSRQRRTIRHLRLALNHSNPITTPQHQNVKCGLTLNTNFMLVRKSSVAFNSTKSCLHKIYYCSSKTLCRFIVALTFYFSK